MSIIGMDAAIATKFDSTDTGAERRYPLTVLASRAQLADIVDAEARAIIAVDGRFSPMRAKELAAAVILERQWVEQVAIGRMMKDGTASEELEALYFDYLDATNIYTQLIMLTASRTLTLDAEMIREMGRGEVIELALRQF